MNWITPAGIPARSARTPSANALSGVSSEGLTTTEHPAASAAAAFLVIMASGKFHGVMAAHTPTGWRVAKTLVSRSCVGITSPYARLASSANHSTNDAA